jgi:hypothetical protein
MKAFSLLVYFIFCMAAVAFVFMNSDKITVNYYWGSVVWSSGIAIVVGFFLGLFFGNIFGSLKGRAAMKRKMMNKFQSTIQAASAKDPVEK